MDAGPKLVLYGPVAEQNSQGKIVREQALAMHRMGYNVGILDTDPKPGHNNGRLSLIRHLLVDKPGDLNHVGDTYLGSARFDTEWIYQVPGKVTRGFYWDKWEYSPQWAEKARRLHGTVTCSRHAQEWLRERGFEATHAPLGVNTRDYYKVEKRLETLDLFKWLIPGSIGRDTLVLHHSGHLQPRKGTRELLKAYRAAFRPTRDDVVLIIHAAKCGWTGQYAKEIKAEIGSGGPPILWCDKELTTDQQRRVWAWASVTVAPNYAEGYGLGNPESMACGVPVVMPYHTGNLETFSEETCWAFRHFTAAPSPRSRDWPQESEWFVPDVDSLADLLLEIYHDRAGIEQRASRCVEEAGRHGWEIGAKAIADLHGLVPWEEPQDRSVTIATLCRQNVSQLESHALKSVSEQKRIQYRQVVVDNGSTVARTMAAVVDEYAKVAGLAGNSVEYLRVEDPNRYGVVARNLVWKTATTKYAASWDDDVKGKFDVLSRSVDHLETHPSCGAVFSLGFYPDATLWASGNGFANGLIYLPGSGNPPLTQHYVDKGVMAASTSLMVFRTKALRDVGFLCEEFAPAWCEDMDLCFALQAAGWGIDLIASTWHTNEKGSPTCRLPGLADKLRSKNELLKSFWLWLLEGDEPRIKARWEVPL